MNPSYEAPSTTIKAAIDRVDNASKRDVQQKAASARASQDTTRLGRRYRLESPRCTCFVDGRLHTAS